MKNPVPLPERLLLSVPEAAQLLGVSAKKVRFLIREGALQAMQVDQRLKVRRVDLNAYLDSLEVDPTDVRVLARMLETSPLPNDNWSQS